MQDLDNLIEQIPIRHNLVSSFILAGLIIASIVVLLVFLRKDSKNQAARVFGFLLLTELLIGLDGYLCYTGLIKYSLHLNDLTEPLSLIIGPLIYLFIKNIVYKESFRIKWDLLHFLVPLIYFISQIIYYIEPLGVKYNAYTQAYHPSLDVFDYSYSSIFLFSDSVKGHLRWYIVASFGLYLLLSIKVYFSQLNQNSTSIKLKEKRHLFSINLLFLIVIVFFVILIVFLKFQNDHGDHYVYLFFTLINFLAAGFIMFESRFFDKSWVADKYETSGLTTAPLGVFSKIDKYVKDESYFLSRSTSLSDLSNHLSMPKNYISQAINEATGKNFNEYINSYRVEEAKLRLVDEAFQHFSIESIGESVGFNAKTTFYAAFRKYTQQTPTAYLKSL